MSRDSQSEETAAQPTRKGVVIAVLFVLWIFAVYLGYYIVHKPFTARIMLAILNSMVDLGCWLALVLLATALGQRLLGKLSFHSLLEELTLSAGVGLGLLSLLTLGLGLLGLLHRWLFYVLLIVGYLLLLPQLKSIIQHLRPGRLAAFPRPYVLLLAGYLALVLGLSLLATLVPPIAWDSQVYHLTGPRLFLEQGKITGGIDIPHLGFPSLLEMLFLAGMALKGAIVAKLTHFGFVLLTAGLLYSFGRRFFCPRMPLLMPAILLSAPSLVLVSTWAYVDMGLAFYTLAAFYALAVWISSRHREWLLLSGVLSGLALGVKYTAVITIVGLGVMVLWESRKRNVKGMIRDFLLFGVTATLVACPWFLRNLLFTGNPVYPFLFGGAYWDEFRSWWYSRWGTGLMSEPLRLLIAPWEMTILGTEGKLGYEATVGPILLACVPLLVFTLLGKSGAKQAPPIFGYAIGLCGAHYLFWLCGVAQSSLLQQTRLLFPIFPLLAVLAGVAVEGLATWDTRVFSVHRFVLLVLAVALALNAVSFVLAFVSDSPLPYILGLETKDKYLNRHLGEYYRAVSFVNEDLPSAARVLFLWEPRSYYCQRDCQPDAILDKFKHLTYEYGDGEGIAEWLHAQGISHVLFHKAGLEHILTARFDPILPTDVAVLETLQQSYLEPIHHVADSYVIYAVK